MSGQRKIVTVFHHLSHIIINELKELRRSYKYPSHVTKNDNTLLQLLNSARYITVQPLLNRYIMV